ncbi:hypothetical protein [Pedobacter foliorum]|uniref:hypothetical protein n=1 Tax=Pedobacter foliorum TaxID=2739058 RepID=UPI0015666AA2|nr:hypothetical protein [Pedobacter foliorum]NRF37407.1 hypothetical protein [Pedobacter foliorum]
MKKNLNLHVLLAFVMLLVLSACGAQRDLKSTVKKIEINKAFAAVYGATQAALAEAGNTGFVIENIDLKFATTTEIETGVGLKLWVLSGSYSKTKSTGKTVVFSFGKATGSDSRFTDDKSTQAYREYLVSVLKAAKTVNPIDKYGLTEFEVEVEFSITDAGGVDAEVELVPITPSLKGSYSKGYTNSTSIKFKKAS